MYSKFVLPNFQYGNRSKWLTIILSFEFIRPTLSFLLSFVNIYCIRTSPSMASVLSISVSSLRLDEATDFNASSGHSENQSIIQHVTRLGNCLSLDLKTSPIGLNETITVSPDIILQTHATHTHIHTHRHTHVFTHTHLYTHTHMYTHKHMHSHMYTQYTYTCMCIHRHIIHTYVHTQLYKHTHKYIHIRTYYVHIIRTYYT